MAPDVITKVCGLFYAIISLLVFSYVIFMLGKNPLWFGVMVISEGLFFSFLKSVPCNYDIRSETDTNETSKI